MKIRMQAGSIRYRLKEPEVREFKTAGIITESIQLGTRSDSFIRFILQKSDNKHIAVQFENNTTVINIPKEISDEWTGTASVGFDAVIELGNERSLKILVEKDFECLEANEEENIGAYPNPKKNC
jgi:hypothetical protein